MSWGFAESLAFAAVMTLRDMTNEKNTHLFKTQKFYQECYQRIADDSSKVFDKVIEVTQKASRCYTPSELGTGSTYVNKIIKQIVWYRNFSCFIIFSSSFYSVKIGINSLKCFPDKNGFLLKINITPL